MCNTNRRFIFRLLVATLIAFAGPAVAAHPDVGTLSWTGIVAPAGTPAPIADRIAHEPSVAFQDDAARVKAVSFDVEVAPDLSPSFFDQAIRAATPWPEFPFGCVKDSGYGSEVGPEALDACLSTRVVSITAV